MVGQFNYSPSELHLIGRERLASGDIGFVAVQFDEIPQSSSWRRWSPDGIGKIISSPRVITANNVKAKIEDGTEGSVHHVPSSGVRQTTAVTSSQPSYPLKSFSQITPGFSHEWRWL